MLQLINRARANPKAEASRLGIDLNQGLARGSISTAAKPPLSFHPNLIKSARGHSRWMLDNDVFSHTGVGNSDSGQRMAAAGYVFSGVWNRAENIGSSRTPGLIDLDLEASARHDSLFLSPDHRTNLCNLALKNIGLGILAGRFLGLNASMVTQNMAFSASYPETLLTGVVFIDKDGDDFYDIGEGVPGVTVVTEGSGWTAVTSASGGYAVPYVGTSGQLDVTFNGGPLSKSKTLTIGKTGNNLEMNLRIPPVPEITVRQLDGAGLTDGKSKISFGSISTESSGRSKTLVIKNTGSARLTGLRVTKTGTHAKDFSVSPLATSSLAAGKSTTFKVTFKPSAKGTRSAEIHIGSNDSDEDPFDIKLTGLGATP